MFKYSRGTLAILLLRQPSTTSKLQANLKSTCYFQTFKNEQRSTLQDKLQKTKISLIGDNSNVTIIHQLSLQCNASKTQHKNNIHWNKISCLGTSTLIMWEGKHVCEHSNPPTTLTWDSDWTIK